MKKFDVIKSIKKEEQFADIILGLVQKEKTPEALAASLKQELTEEELQTVKNAARNGYPLYFGDTRFIPEDSNGKYVGNERKCLGSNL